MASTALLSSYRWQQPPRYAPKGAFDARKRIQAAFENFSNRRNASRRSMAMLSSYAPTGAFNPKCVRSGKP
jgi:hypothetical protein